MLLLIFAFLTAAASKIIDHSEYVHYDRGLSVILELYVYTIDQNDQWI